MRTIVCSSHHNRVLCGRVERLVTQSGTSCLLRFFISCCHALGLAARLLPSIIYLPQDAIEAIGWPHLVCALLELKEKEMESGLQSEGEGAHDTNLLLAREVLKLRLNHESEVTWTRLPFPGAGARWRRMRKSVSPNLTMRKVSINVR